MAKATVTQARQYAQAMGYRVAVGGGIYQGKTRIANGWKDFINLFSQAILAWVSAHPRITKFTRERIANMEKNQ